MSHAASLRRPCQIQRGRPRRYCVHVLQSGISAVAPSASSRNLLPGRLVSISANSQTCMSAACRLILRGCRPPLVRHIPGVRAVDHRLRHPAPAFECLGNLHHDALVFACHLHRPLPRPGDVLRPQMPASQPKSDQRSEDRKTGHARPRSARPIFGLNCGLTHAHYYVTSARGGSTFSRATIVGTRRSGSRRWAVTQHRSGGESQRSRMRG